ncbi:MAG: hypothetical protein CL792_00400 [Chloroflexi bacterium]|nr:hypothetical protein [Chloroflexota bacterium]|tara:strand:- start:18949 stop:20634 length:1686 start_codon:yes stop_codon:yes gene_type:complete
MKKIVTTKQMQSLESDAITSGKSERELQLEAGLAAAQEAWMSVGAMPERGILLLIGPGKNGKDGLIAANQLTKWGATPFVYLLRELNIDDDDWKEYQESEMPYAIATEDTELQRLEFVLNEAALIVDALLGIGMDPEIRPLDENLSEITKRVNQTKENIVKPHILSLDIPTGINADNGYTDPNAVKADSTITFGYAKMGLYCFPGRENVGRIIPVDIGLPSNTRHILPYETLELSELKAFMPERPITAHKGTFGVVTIVGGSLQYPGAIRLAGEAAARSGAGLVQIAAPDHIQALITNGLPDVIHEPLPTTGNSLDTSAAITVLRALDKKKTRALLIGPGLGHTAVTTKFVHSIITSLSERNFLNGVILDADALNILPEIQNWSTNLQTPLIITPHPGEMSRLLGIDIDSIQKNRLETALSYATHINGVVVLKGAGTIIASPDGRARISEFASPVLAKGGTGDILAGIISGLVAQNVEPFEAASLGVYLHADMGRRVAENYGTASGIAQDLLKVMPTSRKMLDGIETSIIDTFGRNSLFPDTIKQDQSEEQFMTDLTHNLD